MLCIFFLIMLCIDLLRNVKILHNTSSVDLYWSITLKIVVKQYFFILENQEIINILVSILPLRLNTIQYLIHFEKSLNLIYWKGNIIILSYYLLFLKVCVNFLLSYLQQIQLSMVMRFLEVDLVQIVCSNLFHKIILSC